MYRNKRTVEDVLSGIVMLTSSLNPLGDFLASRRRALGLSLHELSTTLRCTRTTIWRLERGLRKDAPDDAMIIELERALKLEPGSLHELVQWQRTPLAIRSELIELRRRMTRSVSASAMDDAATLVPIIGEASTIPTEIGRCACSTATMPLSIHHLSCGPADDGAVAVRLAGDGMEPLYRHGDFVIASPTKSMQAGGTCLLSIHRHAGDDGTKSMVACVYPSRSRDSVLAEARAWRLQPLNTTYAPLIITRSLIASAWPVTALIRSIV